MSIDQLKPADAGLVGMYRPYYQGSKRDLLPFAISFYQQGSLEGKRSIEGGESIPFVATWEVSRLPSEITRCQLQFDGNAELRYAVVMANSELVDYLIDVLINFKRTRNIDFSQIFYRKLLNVDE